MTEKELKDRFYCTLGESKQIFLPLRLQKLLGIEKEGKFIVRLDVFSDLTVMLCKDEEETKLERGQKAKDAADAKKAEAARKKK